MTILAVKVTQSSRGRVTVKMHLAGELDGLLLVGLLIVLFASVLALIAVPQVTLSTAAIVALVLFVLGAILILGGLRRSSSCSMEDSIFGSSSGMLVTGFGCISMLLTIVLAILVLVRGIAGP